MADSQTSTARIATAMGAAAGARPRCGPGSATKPRPPSAT